MIARSMSMAVQVYDLLAMAFRTFGLELDPGMTGFPPADNG